MSAGDRKKSSTVRNIYCCLTTIIPFCKVNSEHYQFYEILLSYLEAAFRRLPKRELSSSMMDSSALADLAFKSGS